MAAQPALEPLAEELVAVPAAVVALAVVEFEAGFAVEAVVLAGMAAAETPIVAGNQADNFAEVDSQKAVDIQRMVDSRMKADKTLEGRAHGENLIVVDSLIVPAWRIFPDFACSYLQILYALSHLEIPPVALGGIYQDFPGRIWHILLLS